MKNISRHIKGFFTDKSGKVVLAQPPNLPLALWIIFQIVTFLPLGAEAKVIAHLGASTSLLIWAGMELLFGVNGFRRTLGFVVLIATLSTLFK